MNQDLESIIVNLTPHMKRAALTHKEIAFLESFNKHYLGYEFRDYVHNLVDPALDFYNDTIKGCNITRAQVRTNSLLYSIRTALYDKYK